MKIFQVSNKTIYNWFDKWESDGMSGLYNKKGGGSKPKFNLEQKEKIKESLKKNTKILFSRH